MEYFDEAEKRISFSAVNLHKYFDRYRQNDLSHFLLNKDDNGGFKITLYDFLISENDIEHLEMMAEAGCAHIDNRGWWLVL